MRTLRELRLVAAGRPEAHGSCFFVPVPVAAIEGPSRGEEGIQAFFEGINEATRKFELDVESLQPLDSNRVLASLVLQMESERGFQQEQALTNLYELIGGKPLRGAFARTAAGAR
jgi:hypothetical protein